MTIENDFAKIKVTSKKGEQPNKPFVSEQGMWSILIVIGVILFTMLLVAIIGSSSFVLFINYLFLTPVTSLANFGDFIGELAWLIIVGLSLMVSFRVGVFNIGVFSQFIGGAICGYTVALAFEGPGWIGVLLVFLVAIMAGAFIGWIIAKFKTVFGIHEVLTSIMFNWIMLYLVTFLVSPGGSITFFTLEGEIAPQIITQNKLTWTWANNLFNSTYLNYGVPIAIILVIVFWFMYKKTIWGYKQDILGSNISVGDYVGINKNREWEKSIAISGALAGLAGVIYYLTFKGNVAILVSNDLPVEAFLGITIALLGFCNPIGVLFSSILIAYLTSSQEMIFGIFSIDIVGFILALLIFLLSMINFLMIVRPQEKYFKKNIDNIPWIEHELDVAHMSRYIALIEDNLNYDTYDISEARAYIRYYDKQIEETKQQFINELENKLIDKEKLKLLEVKKDKKINKFEKVKSKEEIRIKVISQKLLKKNEELFKKHKQFLWNQEEKIVSKLFKEIEILENNKNKGQLKITDISKRLIEKNKQPKLNNDAKITSQLLQEIEILKNDQNNEQLKVLNVSEKLILKNDELYKGHKNFLVEQEEKFILQLVEEIEQLKNEINNKYKEVENISQELVKKKQMSLVEKDEKFNSKLLEEIKKLEIKKDKKQIEIEILSKKLTKKQQQFLFKKEEKKVSNLIKEDE